MTTIARAYKQLPDHMQYEAEKKAKLIVDTMFQAAQPDWSLPVSIEQSKEEIMRAAKAAVDDDDDEPKPKKKKKKKGSKKDDESKKKKKKKKRKKQGLEDGSKDAQTSANPEDLEEDNKNKKDQEDIDLINDFKSEIDDIRKALEEDDKNDSKPKPEEW